MQQVAQEVGLPLNVVMEANGLVDASITHGSIVIPRNVRSHTIVAGETLSGIVGDDALVGVAASMNDIENANVIHPGKVLIIPVEANLSYTPIENNEAPQAEALDTELQPADEDQEAAEAPSEETPAQPQAEGLDTEETPPQTTSDPEESDVPPVETWIEPPVAQQEQAVEDAEDVVAPPIIEEVLGGDSEVVPAAPEPSDEEQSMEQPSAEAESDTVVGTETETVITEEALIEQAAEEADPDLPEMQYITLPEGSTVSAVVEVLLSNHPQTYKEFAGQPELLTNAILADSGISDPASVPAGANIAIGRLGESDIVIVDQIQAALDDQSSSTVTVVAGEEEEGLITPDLPEIDALPLPDILSQNIELADPEDGANEELPSESVNLGAIEAINGVQPQRIQEVLTYLMDEHGVPVRGAAFLTGNFIQESALKPEALNQAEGSHGLAQWRATRLTADFPYASNYNNDLEAIHAQLDFAMNEMESVSYYNEAYEAYMDPNATDAELARAAKVFEGYGEVGKRDIWGAQLVTILTSEEQGHAHDHPVEEESAEEAPTAEASVAEYNLDHPLIDIDTLKPERGKSNSSGEFDQIHVVQIEGVYVNASIAFDAASMIQAARDDGLDIRIGSGWRSIEEQESLRVINGCEEVYSGSASDCDVPTAIPGKSNHNSGEALDIASGSGALCFPASTEDCIKRGDKVVIWLTENAADYGFKNLPSEAWHWSRNGK